MSTLSAPFSLKNDKGFSLVELMIVVAIIGVLSALAVPKFQSFQAKAKQSEAKSNLSHIYTLEQSYFGDRDVFYALIQTPTSGVVPPNDLGFDIQGHRRYQYNVALTAAGFDAFAYANTLTVISSNCLQKDQWKINHLKELYLVYDCVKGGPGPTTPL